MNNKYIIDNCKPYVIEDGVAREVDYNSEGVFYVVKGGKTIENIEGYELFNLYEIERKFNVEENALYKEEIEEIEENIELEEEPKVEEPKFVKKEASSKFKNKKNK